MNRPLESWEYEYWDGMRAAYEADLEEWRETYLRECPPEALECPAGARKPNSGVHVPECSANGLELILGGHNA